MTPASPSPTDVCLKMTNDLQGPAELPANGGRVEQRIMNPEDPSSSSRLPGDILYLVLEELEKIIDYKTAVSCLWVCREWRAWAKKLVPTLMPDITLYSKTDVVRISRTLWPGPGILKINGSGPDGLSHLAQWAATFARRWQRMSWFEIWNGEWRAEEMSRTLFWDLSLYNISKLKLFGVKFPTSATFVKLILHLPMLRVVHLGDVTFAAAGSNFSPPTLPASRMTKRQRGVTFHLGCGRYVYGTDAVRVHEFFLHLGKFLRHADYLLPGLIIGMNGPIPTLEKRLNTATSSLPLQELLDTAGPSLSTVELFGGLRVPQLVLSKIDRIIRYATNRAAACNLSVAKNTRVQQLVLNLQRRDDYASAAHVLSSVTSSSVREITIRCRSFNLESPVSRKGVAKIAKFGKECILPVDKVLTESGNKFINLERVRVILPLSAEDSMTAYYLEFEKAYFPRLSEVSEVMLQITSSPVDIYTM